MLDSRTPCDPVRILTLSTIANVPKETATATSGCVRRHSRGPMTASAARSSSGRGAKSWRSTQDRPETASTRDQQTSTATKAQSRGPRSGAFVGRGSAHSERSAFVAI